ncbi:hypothetical protein PIB30_031565 [Stylosanthes scabra]|uniref:Uncharacterized protein n=1 Tax=Stylosanthes scabra TaxID=79078 RepID=A0ABU6RC40_9FABA|nr:hypothetical protein [Stylosanthes scabra]
MDKFTILSLSLKIAPVFSDLTGGPVLEAETLVVNRSSLVADQSPSLWSQLRRLPHHTSALLAAAPSSLLARFLIASGRRSPPPLLAAASSPPVAASARHLVASSSSFFNFVVPLFCNPVVAEVCDLKIMLQFLLEDGNSWKLNKFSFFKTWKLMVLSNNNRVITWA